MPGKTTTLLVEVFPGKVGAAAVPYVAPGTQERVVVGITLQGHTADGDSISSGEYNVALNLCNGCLVPPPCGAGKILTPTNCFGSGQDSAPTCL
jgi:hypothetical protein